MGPCASLGTMFVSIVWVLHCVRQVNSVQGMSVQSLALIVPRTEALPFHKSSALTSPEIPRYLLSREEIAAHLALRSSERRITQLKSRQTETGLLRKRGLNPSYYFCVGLDKYTRERHHKEDWHWVDANCIEPYTGPSYIVRCRLFYRDGIVQPWKDGGVHDFIDNCVPDQKCHDRTTEKYHDGKKTNTVDCYGKIRGETSSSSSSDEEGVEAIRASPSKEVESCKTMTISDASSSAQNPGTGRPPSPPSRRHVYELQEEVTLVGGGDYKAASLFFRDLNLPYHMRAWQIAARNYANVTNHDIVIDHGVGSQSRQFEFCVRLQKSSNPRGGPWVIHHYSHIDITNGGGHWTKFD